MILVLADFVDDLPAWWERHGMALGITSLIGLVIADRFLAGRRGSSEADPANDDYSDPPHEFDSGVYDER